MARTQKEPATRDPRLHHHSITDHHLCDCDQQIISRSGGLFTTAALVLPMSYAGETAVEDPSTHTESLVSAPLTEPPCPLLLLGSLSVVQTGVFPFKVQQSLCLLLLCLDTPPNELHFVHGTEGEGGG